jgi:phosphoglycerol transferase MdoB-like AlkP superfamily enzyme
MNETAKPKLDYAPKITGGLILILLVVLFLFTEMDKISWEDWWAYFLVGLGAIFLIEALLRTFSPEGRKAIGGRLVAGPILIVIGGSRLIGLEHWWPLVLIAVGLGVLISALVKR